VGAVLVGGFAVLAIGGSAIAPYSPTDVVTPPDAAGLFMRPPGWHHLLGTTRVGQDVLSQLVIGSRSALAFAFMAGGATALVGGALGMISGWWRSWPDALLMGAADLMLAVPRIPLLVLAGLYAGNSRLVLVMALTLIFWPGPARVVRAQVLSLRRRAHVKAAVGFGAGAGHVLRRHLGPEVGLILVERFVTAAAVAITLQAGLLFLGVGDPRTVSWGQMIQEAQGYPTTLATWAWTWWLLLPPVVAIMSVVLGLTLIGTVLEERVNPRLGRHPAGGPPTRRRHGAITR
jgi:peptide/nickel transport system ATP-binding protein